MWLPKESFAAQLYLYSGSCLTSRSCSSKDSVWHSMKLKLRQVDLCRGKTGSSSGDEALNKKLNQVYADLESIEADKAPAKAGAILFGLGFTPDMQDQPTRYC